MIIQFTFQELMVFLVCVLGITILIISIPVILNVKRAVKSILFILEDNKKDIKTALKNVPRMINNTDQIIGNITVISEKVKNTSPGILNEIEIVTNLAKESLESAGVIIDRFASDGGRDDSEDKNKTNGFMGYIRIIEEIIEIICRAFSANR